MSDKEIADLLERIEKLEKKVSSYAQYDDALKSMKKAFDDNEARKLYESSGDIYEDAKKIVQDTGKASTSYIQRRMKIGYSRAARLMDELEDDGVIGPADGSKPREILEKDVDKI